MTACTAPTAGSCSITRATRCEPLRDAGAAAPSVLAGPTCDSIDVIAEKLMLPPLKAGDLVVGRAMGAYTWASATDFNFFPRATVVAVNRRAGDTRQRLHGTRGSALMSGVRIEAVVFDIGWVLLRLNYRPILEFLAARGAALGDRMR